MRGLDQNGWHCRLCGQPLTKDSHDRADSDITLSVLIPVHNEGGQIAQNLSLIQGEALKTGLSMQMLVIDDGSTDNTWQVLESAVRQMPEVKVLRFSRNLERRRRYVPESPIRGGKHAS
jgi:cellulose synthase/poly-beta-1,6-N-acetylglucosamine synthase-like glycosyltransferase